MAFAVLRKGWPKIMGALTSPPIFKTTKSTGTYDCPTWTMESSRTPLGSRVTDLQAANTYLCITKDLLGFSHKLP